MASRWSSVFAVIENFVAPPPTPEEVFADGFIIERTINPKTETVESYQKKYDSAFLKYKTANDLGVKNALNRIAMLTSEYMWFVSQFILDNDTDEINKDNEARARQLFQIASRYFQQAMANTTHPHQLNDIKNNTAYFLSKGLVATKGHKQYIMIEPNLIDSAKLLEQACHAGNYNACNSIVSIYEKLAESAKTKRSPDMEIKYWGKALENAKYFVDKLKSFITYVTSNENVSSEYKEKEIENINTLHSKYNTSIIPTLEANLSAVTKGGARKYNDTQITRRNKLNKNSIKISYRKKNKKINRSRKQLS
jgi:hypothetical protein